jgi:transposase, IS5 family
MIGHLKSRGGDRINAVLAAAGFNFRLLLRWLRRLLSALLLILARALLTPRFA